MRKVKITKTKGISDKVPIGTAKEGWQREEPQIGKSYVLYQHDGSIFRTSVVTEIIEGGFETASSTYEVEVLESDELHEADESKKLDDTESMTEWKCIPKTVSIHCTDGTNIKGKVNLGHESRVSDLFTSGNTPFVVVFDASIKGEMGKTIALNKSAIAWVNLED